MITDPGRPPAGIRLPQVDAARAHREVIAACEMFRELARTADPRAPAVGTWTVHEVVAHLAGSLPTYVRMAREEGSPQVPSVPDLARQNEQTLRPVHDLPTVELARRIEEHTAEFLRVLAAAAPDRRVAWMFGADLPLGSFPSLLLGEFAVHGRDIARATGRRWAPPVAWGHTAFRGLLPVMPLVLDRERAAGRRGRFDIRLRGEDTRVLLELADGQIQVLPARGRVRADCHFLADPWAFLLVLYGRTGPIPGALTGKVLAWGPRAWLGMGLPALFHRF